MTATVLVAGASGVVGTAAVERFLADGWDVVAVSRRAPEVDGEGLAASPAGRPDARPTAAPRCSPANAPSPTSSTPPCPRAPGLTPGWYDPAQMRLNEAMLRNLLDALRAAGADLQHVGLLQGTKAYGAHHHPIRVPARERAARDPHENFYWLQEDLVPRAQCRRGLDVHHPAAAADRRPEPRGGDERAAGDRCLRRHPARARPAVRLPRRGALRVGGRRRPARRRRAGLGGHHRAGRGRDVQRDQRRGVRVARPVAGAGRRARRRGRAGRAAAPRRPPAGARRRRGVASSCATGCARSR